MIQSLIRRPQKLSSRNGNQITSGDGRSEAATSLLIVILRPAPRRCWSTGAQLVDRPADPTEVRGMHTKERPGSVRRRSWCIVMTPSELLAVYEVRKSSEKTSAHAHEDDIC